MSDFSLASLRNEDRTPAPDAEPDSRGVALDRASAGGTFMPAEAMHFERQILTLESSSADSTLRIYRGQVETLQAQLNGLQAQFKGVSSDIAGRISGLEAELAAVRGALARAAPEEGRQTSTLQARKVGLTTQLAAAEREDYTTGRSNTFQIGALMGTQAEIESLARAIQGQLRSIEARIQALQLI